MSHGRNNIYLKPLLQNFMLAMSRKFQKHRDWDKSGPSWRQAESVWPLVDRLQEEVVELCCLLDFGDDDEISLSNIEDECADIANCALMISDWCKENPDAFS